MHLPSRWFRLVVGLCACVASTASLAAAQSPSGGAPSAAWRAVAQASDAWIDRREDVARAAWEDSLRHRPEAAIAWLSLAVLAREASDWRGADSLRREAWQAVRRDTAVARVASSFAAVLWLEAARAANARGEFLIAGEAMDSAVREARIANDTIALASALSGAAALRGRTRSAVAQRATLDSLRPLKAMADPLLRFRDACVVAGTQAPSDRDGLRAVLALAADAEQARAAGTCLFAVATMFSERGLQYETAVLLDSALVAFRRGRSPIDEAAVLQWLGNLLARGGQYARAERYLSDGLRIALTADYRSLTAWIHLNLASTAIGRGDRTRALRSLELARSLATELGDGYALADATTLYGELLLDDEEWSALDAHLSAATSVTTTLGASAAQAELRADMAMRRGDLATAREWLARSDSIAARRGANWRPAVALHQAWLDLRDNRPRAAATVLDTLRWRFSRAQVPARLLANAALAEAYLAIGLVDSAVTALDEALTSIETLLQIEPTNRLRVLAARTRQPFGGARAAGAPQAAIVGLATVGRLAEAFASSERLRARALLEALLLAAPIDDESADARAVRRAEQYAPATLAEVQRALPDDRTALVSFLTGPVDVGTMAIVVLRDTVRAVTLPGVEALAPLIQRLTAALSDGGNTPRLRALRDGLARELGDALMAPVLAHVPDATRHLVLVADDILHRVPFAALRPGGRPLRASLALSTVPSAAVAHLVWQRHIAVGGHTVVLAAPEPPVEGDRDAAWRAPLRGAAREGRAVQRAVRGAQLFRGADASEARLRALSDDPPAVLHIAAHAEVNDQEVDDGLLILSASAGADGFVTPAELATLRLPGTLVVLSGCRTARGPIVGGEGVRGLVPPLLTAGAAVVLSTQWDVGDDGLAPLMARFYEALVAGHTAAEALRLVQVEAQAQQRPTRDWAALTLAGNGDWRLPPSARSAGISGRSAKVASRSF